MFPPNGKAKKKTDGEENESVSKRPGRGRVKAEKIQAEESTKEEEEEEQREVFSGVDDEDGDDEEDGDDKEGGDEEGGDDEDGDEEEEEEEEEDEEEEDKAEEGVTLARKRPAAVHVADLNVRKKPARAPTTKGLAGVNATEMEEETEGDVLASVVSCKRLASYCWSFTPSRSKAICRGCGEKMQLAELRFEVEFGGRPDGKRKNSQFFHLSCMPSRFVEKIHRGNGRLGKLPGFGDLKDDDKKRIKAYDKEADVATCRCPDCHKEMEWSEHAGNYIEGWSCSNIIKTEWYKKRRCKNDSDNHGPFRWVCKDCEKDFCGVCRPPPDTEEASTSEEQTFEHEQGEAENSIGRDYHTIDQLSEKDQHPPESGPQRLETESEVDCKFCGKFHEKFDRFCWNCGLNFGCSGSDFNEYATTANRNITASQPAQTDIVYPCEEPLPAGLPAGWKAIRYAYGPNSQSNRRTYLRYQSLDGQNKHVSGVKELFKQDCRKRGCPDEWKEEYDKFRDTCKRHGLRKLTEPDISTIHEPSTIHGCVWEVSHEREEESTQKMTNRSHDAASLKELRELIYILDSKMVRRELTRAEWKQRRTELENQVTKFQKYEIVDL